MDKLCVCFHLHSIHFLDACRFQTKTAKCKCIKFVVLQISPSKTLCIECLGAGYPRAWEGGRELKNCIKCSGLGFIEKPKEQ